MSYTERGYKQHGSRHRRMGSDPIFDGDPILFNYDNEGGWLLVVANDPQSDAPGVGDAGVAIVDKTGDGAYLISIDESSYSDVGVDTTFVNLSADVGGTPVNVAIGGAKVQINIGGVLLFQLDADGTLHLKAGSSIVTDL